jgi:hypothetical protein
MKRFIQWALLAVPLMFAGAVFARTPAPAGVDNPKTDHHLC